LDLPLWNRAITAGFLGGVNLVNIGPGHGDRASTDRLFSPQTTPALGRQSPYLFTGPVLTFDWRDFPGDPHKGTLIEASYLYYQDYDTSQYSFRRFTGQVEQYIPFFNHTRVIALRGRTEMSFVPPGNTVPFYLQPTLGGPDDVRGFDRYRFYDNNSLILNAEYRFEVASALDMAFFVDSGSVYRRPGLVGFRNMEESGGLGFRFKTRNQVFMRFDTGVSREGLQVWLQFSNAFALLPRFR
jgi:outer membrane protein assembly factor BamA